MRDVILDDGNPVYNFIFNTVQRIRNGERVFYQKNDYGELAEIKDIIYDQEHELYLFEIVDASFYMSPQQVKMYVNYIIFEDGEGDDKPYEAVTCYKTQDGVIYEEKDKALNHIARKRLGKIFTVDEDVVVKPNQIPNWENVIKKDDVYKIIINRFDEIKEIFDDLK